MEYRITDLHSHVIPGVDDGAQDLDQALSALDRLAADGVVRVVATPHFRASLLEQPAREADRLRRFDEAYAQLTEAAAAEGLEIGIERGCEFKLDAPAADLSDARLRLAGTRYALVEFSSFQLPAYAGNQLASVRDAGWIPLLAHPERYAGLTKALDRVERWVSQGTLLQVNARSLLGLYGPEAQLVACELLRLGWVCCLASDYHARGTPEFGAVLGLLAESRVVPAREPARPGAALTDTPAANPEMAEGLETVDELETADERAQALQATIEALVSVNPEHILADRPTEPVRGLDIPDVSRKKKTRRWFR